jgi:hypothetical protein
MPGTDLVYASASLEDRKNYARAIAAAGSLLPAGLMERDERGRDVPSPGKILLVAETGNMLGIHPVAAITGVNIIQGKPSVAPALMSALVRQRGHKLRVKVTGTVGTGDLAVTVTLIRSDDPEAPFDVTWTLQDAINAGLVDSYALNPTTKKWAIKPASGKGTWKSYPRQMLLHRATAEVCRQGANEVVMGVYTPEELGATVNGEGEMVDITSTAIDRTAIQDAEVVEQDEDGPAVVATMQEGIDTTGIADEWAIKAARAITRTAALELFREAKHRGFLPYVTSGGEMLNDILLERGKTLAAEEAQAAAGEPGPVPEPQAPTIGGWDESELV